jgi:hypothetical protein
LPPTLEGGGVTADQLVLFAREGPATTRRKGPAGLLAALVHAGLDEDALKPAAALVLALDESTGERRRAAA